MELVPTHQARRLSEPISLDDLIDRVRADKERCEDHLGIDLRETHVYPDGTWRYNGSSARLTRHSLTQLCSRIPLPGGGTVPHAYLQKCPADLAAANLNRWISEFPPGEKSEVLVRTIHDGYSETVRAVLSSRYAFCDHLDVLMALREGIENSDLKLQGWSLDDEVLTLRMLLGTDHPASLGDPIRAGVSIINSEVGLSQVSIQGLVTRLVCSNGLVVNVADLGGLQRRHVGRAWESLQEILSDGLANVLRQAQEAAEQFLHLREVKLTKPMPSALRAAATKLDLPAPVLVRAIGRATGDTVFDLVNAFTEAAQTLPVIERLQVESAVSRLLRNHSSN